MDQPEIQFTEEQREALTLAFEKVKEVVRDIVEAIRKVFKIVVKAVKHTPIYYRLRQVIRAKIMTDSGVMPKSMRFTKMRRERLSYEEIYI